MGLRLSVRSSAWHRSVERVAATLPGLIPVVKGTGYGFGRVSLMPVAAGLAERIAVGTVYEAFDVPPDRTAIVLTPQLDRLPRDLPASVVLTVGSTTHVDALHDNAWTGRVVLKLQSSMRRYGVTPDQLGSLAESAAAAGLTADSAALHLPLAGTADDHLEQVEAWLTHLDPALPLAVSHLDPQAYAWLVARHPDRRFGIRVGTALWHADKADLHLSAAVVDRHRVVAGDVAGYRGVNVPADGHIVLVAAGSAHGVAPLDGGLSPFHFARRRLTLIESPHMHTSMVFVPAADPCPEVGQRVDVQRPLITTIVDELEWIDD